MKWSFNTQKNLDSVLRQVRKKWPNDKTRADEFITVLLDTSYMTADDYAAFIAELMKQASPDELARVIEVNVKL